MIWSHFLKTVWADIHQPVSTIINTATVIWKSSSISIYYLCMLFYANLQRPTSFKVVKLDVDVVEANAPWCPAGTVHAILVITNQHVLCRPANCWRGVSQFFKGVIFKCLQRTWIKCPRRRIKYICPIYSCAFKQFRLPSRVLRGKSASASE